VPAVRIRRNVQALYTLLAAWTSSGGGDLGCKHLIAMTIENNSRGGGGYNGIVYIYSSEGIADCAISAQARRLIASTMREGGCFASLFVVALSYVLTV